MKKYRAYHGDIAEFKAKNIGTYIIQSQSHIIREHEFATLWGGPIYDERAGNILYSPEYRFFYPALLYYKKNPSIQFFIFSDTIELSEENEYFFENSGDWYNVINHYKQVIFAEKI